MSWAVRCCLTFVGAALALGATLGAPTAGAAPGATAGPGRVLVIAAPRLTWDEVQADRPPNLMKLFASSAVAMNSPRTAGSTTRPGDAYLTIGAGNRMSGVPDTDGLVVGRSESTADGDPTAIYQRTTGITPKEDIVSLSKPVIDKANEQYHFGAEAGALGSALRSGHRRIGVIANADHVFGLPEFRQAGLAAMSESGQVDDGLVSGELLRADPEAAFGVAIDPSVYTSVFDETWQRDDVVLAELSDLERAEAARVQSTAEQGDAQYRHALRASDALVGAMLRRVDLSRDTVIVLGPTAPADQNQMTVFAMAGRGVTTGWATSSTTRRDGYVTLTDIAPSILARFGVAVPDSMGDTRLRSVADGDHPGAAGFGERVDWMVDESNRAVVRDDAFGPITVVFVVVVVIDIALAMLCLARLPWLSGLVRALALVVLAVPPVTFLLGLVPIESAPLLGVAVAAGAVLLAVLVYPARRLSGAAPALVLFALLWSVLAVDIVTGGRLQINTVFGYSPIVAGRFAGFGNQAFSMIAISALLLASEWVARRTGERGRVVASTLAAVVVWFAVTVVLDGHPSFGADVGGVLAFVPAATVAFLMFAGVRIRARLLALVLAATVVVLGVFAAIDTSRPTEDQTHLGRFMSKVFNGDAGQIIERKVAANLRVLTSVWAWVIPVALVYFMYLTWRPNRTLQRLNGEHRQFRAFGVSALILGVLAMVLNDSGVSMPAMMVALVAAYVSYLVIDLERSPRPDALDVTDPVRDRQLDPEPEPFPEPST